jgi:hypothetical protein
MSKISIFGIVSLLAVGMIFSSPLTASFAAPQSQPADYLDLEKTIVKIKEDPVTENNTITDVIYKVGGYVPEYDMVPPFGYGVITLVTNETGGTELNVIATTSHSGLLDSQAQEDDPENPILHNHFAVLGNNATCGNLPSIDALSFEEIGQVFVDGKTIIVKDLPPSALDRTNQTEITPGTNIQFVASFLLEPVFDDQNPDELIAVCVNPVDEQNDRTVIFGDEEQKPYYPKPDYGNNDRYGNDYQNGYDNEYSDGYSEYSSEYGNDHSDQYNNDNYQENSYDEKYDDGESRD